jgi:undecaprenyl-diphosphatase
MGKWKLPHRLPPLLILGAGANLAVTLILGKVANGLGNGRAEALDKTVGHRAQDSMRHRLDPLMGLLSSAGEPFVLYPLTGVVAARWVRQDQAAAAATLGLALVGSAALSKVVKLGTNRERPTFRLPRTETSGASFPSQHVMMSLATYGAFVYLSTRHPKPPDRRAIVRRWAVALTLCGLIGWSRIYQGVHHPTDVLGGWVAGSLWLLTCVAAHHTLDSPRAKGPAPGWLNPLS